MKSPVTGRSANSGIVRAHVTISIACRPNNIPCTGSLALGTNPDADVTEGRLPSRVFEVLFSAIADLPAETLGRRAMRRRCQAPRPSGTGVGKLRPRTDRPTVLPQTQEART